MSMGIVDTRPLEARARKLFALAHAERARGEIAFAQQLEMQARKYLKECAVLDTHCEQETDRHDGALSGREDFSQV
jgi:hypothetical protein